MSARRRPVPVPAPTVPAGPLVPTPTSWARERIAAARETPVRRGLLGWALGQPAPGPVPSYGSPEWEALAAEDPRKLAAALVAAEVYRYEAATLADRLRLELDQIATDHAIEDGARASMAREEALAEYTRRAVRPGRPSYGQLAERRGEPDRAAAWRARDPQTRERADRSRRQTEAHPPLQPDVVGMIRRLATTSWVGIAYEGPARPPDRRQQAS